MKLPCAQPVKAEPTLSSHKRRLCRFADFDVAEDGADAVREGIDSLFSSTLAKLAKKW